MPEPTVPVRLVAGEFRYDREHYTAGDELQVHERALEAHPRSLERIDESADAGGSGSEPRADPDEIDPKPQDLTVDELEQRIADVDDLRMLRGIRYLEAEADHRTTALEAIDDRIEDLDG